jgi:hypothetical protein
MADKEETVPQTKTKGKKGAVDEEKKEKVVIQLGPPNVGNEENVFAVAHIFASWNGTVPVSMARHFHPRD